MTLDNFNSLAPATTAARPRQLTALDLAARFARRREDMLRAVPADGGAAPHPLDVLDVRDGDRQ